TDAVLALCLLLSSSPDPNDKAAQGDHSVALAAPIIRSQYVLFYFATAVWKANYTFLSPAVSCAPIFFLQLLDTYVPAALVPHSLPFLAARSAPWVTLGVEGLIPALLSLRAPFSRAGIALGALLHLLIAITPPPNSAGAFSLACLVRYFFFLPEALACVATPPTIAILAPLAALGFAIAPHDPSVPFYLAGFGLFAAALLRSPSPSPPPPTPPRCLPLVRRAAIFFALVYGFALPVLGLQDMMAPTMFGNVRIFTPSNHPLLPTGLLLDHLPALRGGLVVVEATTSPSINAICPAEVTDFHSDLVRQQLRESGHSSRQFAPYLARVIGPHAVTPAHRPPSHASIAKGEGWMVPMVELRRLLAEARGAGENFTLTLRKRDAETSPWRRLRLSVEAMGGTSCSLLSSRGGCSEEEEELLSSAPPPWVMHGLAFFPFPVRLSEDLNASTTELGCL
ncbi:MAG: hypothetical protein SGPRY_012820, partial [Prymnesium sp.]